MESHNAVLKNTMTKINADPELNFLSQNDILNYAVMDKNSIMNQRGLTPFRIVFGSGMNRQDIENELMNAKTANSEMVKAH